MSDPGVQEERDVREAFDALVRSGPPVGFGSTELLAAGRRARRRRGLLTGGAVVGSTAVLLGAVALAGVGPNRTPGPAAERTPSPELVAGPVPGLSAAEAERAATYCRSTAAGVHPGARLYNVADDRIGRTVLLYGPGTVVLCHRETDGTEGGTGELGRTADWLPGVVVVDRERSAARQAGPPAAPAWGMAIGRVGRTVARVEASVRTATGTATATVRPVNGTYVVRVILPAGQNPAPGAIVVAAYDAADHLLDSTSLDDTGPCYVTPDGTRVDNALSADRQQCLPAVRWP